LIFDLPLSNNFKWQLNKNSADYCWARFEELIEIYNKELK
jgi:hypothetical protein